MNMTASCSKPVLWGSTNACWCSILSGGRSGIPSSAITPGYQEIRCHMIFDIKMGENFRRKARMVADGHQTETPAALTYSSVVSRDSVQIALTIAALND